MPVQVAIASAVSAPAVFTIPLNIHNSGDNDVQWVFGRSGNGSFTGTVEYTIDKIQDTEASAKWVVINTLATADTATAATVTHPISAIRLNITAASGNNQVGFRVLQLGV